jgi:leader peptidase (prepilin peptidase)/N-methyltransferase
VELLLARLESSWALLGVAFILGALIGSFLNVVIARLPEGLSIARPASRCPACETPIRPRHNVPILSWLALRGRCAACRAPISPRYPLVEAVTGALFAAGAARFGLEPALFAAWAFMAALVAVTFIDLDVWEVPDEITVPGALAAVVVRPLVFEVPWWSGLAGAALGAGFLLGVRWLYFAWRGAESMGLGDVKLIALIGGFLGPGALIPTLTLGSCLGAVIGGLALLLERRRSSETDAAEAKAPSAPAPEVDALEPWARRPRRLALGVLIRWSGRRWRLGVPPDLTGRTHLRLGLVLGARGRGGRSGREVVLGVFQDVAGWGHFEGLSLGHPPRLWFGPVLGARTPDVEVHGEDDPWTPPPGAIPFGPFLALGALATLLLAPLFGRWSTILGLV